MSLKFFIINICTYFFELPASKQLKHNQYILCSPESLQHIATVSVKHVKARSIVPHSLVFFHCTYSEVAVSVLLVPD